MEGLAAVLEDTELGDIVLILGELEVGLVAWAKIVAEAWEQDQSVVCISHLGLHVSQVCE